jgi:hypothetical protein
VAKFSGDLSSAESTGEKRCKCVVLYKTTTEADRKEYQRLRVLACCDDMADAFEDSCPVAFGGIYMTDARVGMFWKDGYYGDNDNFEPINFCPFCAAPIECIEAMLVEKTRHTRKVEQEETIYSERVVRDDVDKWRDVR